MLPIEQIHPLVVHFPIVFALLLAMFDLVVVFRGLSLDGRGAIANISAGLGLGAGLAAAVAFVFGDLALDVALANGTSLAILERHEELGSITAGVLVAWGLLRAVIWWRGTVLSRRLCWGAVVFELAIAGLIVTTAYFGGQLVYEFGVGVSLPSGL
ncbi:putative membrane protein [Spongiibacter sp. IMCC21906]|uniref:DUF2231 domain-containing protein n=1 Tax=Spongiibacter sp. IMCC21906 TaxID=1620392 RepID=UPI00062DFBCC|nr:DUF2231 domain-containing protein [Spongiibacter sp. IMCC21906]AKH68817.1 putative membrane protein [Spongiibacter sp. IMCC21906]